MSRDANARKSPAATAAAQEERSVALTSVLRSGGVIEALNEIRSGKFNHVLQAERLDHKNAKERVRKLESLYDYTPAEIEQLYLSERPQSFETTFANPFTKDSSVKALMNWVRQAKPLGRRVPQIETVLGELALNGLYSSASAFKNQYGYDYSFKTECRLRVSYDSTKVLLSCWDPVGSMQRDKVVDRLLDLYRSDQSIEINRDTGRQSGFGLKLIVDNCTDLIVLCTKMKETFVGCSMPIKGPAAALESRPKCFHFIVRS